MYLLGKVTMARRDRRIMRDLSIDTPLLREEGIWLAAEPDNLQRIHFVFPGGSDTKQHGGLFHGMILVNDNYPHSPNSIYMLTESGRLKTSHYPPKPSDRGICMTMTAYHPEDWSPLWTFRTVILGLITHMNDPEATGKGLLDAPNQEALAKKSINAIKKDEIVQKLFPELIQSLNDGTWTPPK